MHSVYTCGREGCIVCVHMWEGGVHSVYTCGGEVCIVGVCVGGGGA